MKKIFGKAMIMAAGFVLAACSSTRQEAATMLVNYTDDSIYNVHGVCLTLAEYHAAMNVTLKQANIQMGDFQNIIICDDWAAIRYATETISPDGKRTPGGKQVRLHIPAQKPCVQKNRGSEKSRDA